MNLVAVVYQIAGVHNPGPGGSVSSTVWTFPYSNTSAKLGIKRKG